MLLAEGRPVSTAPVEEGDSDPDSILGLAVGTHSSGMRMQTNGFTVVSSGLENDGMPVRPDS